MRGQVTVTTAIIASAATVVVAALGSWGTSSARVSQVDTKVEVLQERQELQYKEIKESLTRLESKIDNLQ